MAKLKIVGNDIVSPERGKVGYTRTDDVYDVHGKKIGYYQSNDIYNEDGHKIGYLEGADVYDERGIKVSSLDKLHHDIEGGADAMMKTAIYLLFLR